uniref:Uncharacterized protein LOC123616687 n=1 Tax=Camelus bactrianus TaxID=9837 RepID=A0A9W3HHS0_CAMBA|nr:uncharacterized protein LOC123616687 [Camelus bactrianus]
MWLAPHAPLEAPEFAKPKGTPHGGRRLKIVQGPFPFACVHIWLQPLPGGGPLRSGSLEEGPLVNPFRLLLTGACPWGTWQLRGRPLPGLGSPRVWKTGLLASHCPGNWPSCIPASLAQGKRPPRKSVGLNLTAQPPIKSREKMGRPGPPGEKVSDTQLSDAPAVPHRAPADGIPGPEDSDLVPSLSLAAALVLLFLLLSAWLVRDRPLQGSC